MVHIFILAAAIPLFISISAHYLVFHTLVIFLKITNPSQLVILKIIFAALSASFIIASILISYFSNFLVRIFYIISSVWLGALFYLFLACLSIYLILFISQQFSLSVSPKIMTISLLSAAAIIAGYGLLQARNIKIKTLDLALPNLPLEWRGKTAIYLSDLHLGQVDNNVFAARLAKLIEGQQPDLLLIGGDFYDGQTNFDLTALASEFAVIKAPLGKYFVTGNHEEFGDNGKFVSALTNAGIIFLNNRLVNINGLQLIGVDYRTAYSRKNFSEILKNLNINKNAPSLLLRHVPDKIDIAAANGISLMLCGHAHKGQLFPVQFIDRLIYGKYYYGLNKTGATQVYTTSGAGTWGPPLRIMADPEIVLIKFK
ncbi:MAG: metallophosphoesterase [bacterium]|nr:metallophosphoesterase [bacterium]